MKVSIHEVARQAEVSISTVSRAFNAPQLLHPDTLARVLEVAGALGYQPNRAARGLITGTTGNLGLIVPDVANPFFPGLVKSAQSRARSADYAVFLADTDEDPAVELELIRAMAKQVDGIILASSRMSEAQVLEAAGLTSLAFVNRLMRGIPAVTLDSAGGMRQALEHLIALGHRRVVFLNGPRNSWSNRERRRGLRSVAGRSGLEVIELAAQLDALGHGLDAERLAQRDDRVRERGFLGSFADILDEHTVDLDDIDREPSKVAQRGVAGPEVVERQPHPEQLELAEQVDGGVRVLHQRGLRDLQHEATRVDPCRIRPPADIGEERLALELPRGDVDTHADLLVISVPMA
jgi:transcriptional regulator with XRE-family HTH domain